MGGITKALSQYFKNRYQHLTIQDNLFQIIKIQFMALGLINVREAKTTQGGVAEFISLKSKGHSYMINKIAVKLDKK